MLGSRKTGTESGNQRSGEEGDSGAQRNEDGQEYGAGAEEKRPACSTFAHHQHGHEGEQHGVQDDGIQCVEGADGDGQGIGARVRAEHVGSYADAEETSAISEEDAGSHYSAAANQIVSGVLANARGKGACQRN